MIISGRHAPMLAHAGSAVPDQAPGRRARDPRPGGPGARRGSPPGRLPKVSGGQRGEAVSPHERSCGGFRPGDGGRVGVVAVRSPARDMHEVQRRGTSPWAVCHSPGPVVPQVRGDRMARASWCRSLAHARLGHRTNWTATAARCEPAGEARRGASPRLAVQVLQTAARGGAICPERRSVWPRRAHVSSVAGQVAGNGESRVGGQEDRSAEPGRSASPQDERRKGSRCCHGGELDGPEAEG